MVITALLLVLLVDLADVQNIHLQKMCCLQASKPYEVLIQGGCT
jgi:hypothetical protein